MNVPILALVVKRVFPIAKYQATGPVGWLHVTINCLLNLTVIYQQWTSDRNSLPSHSHYIQEVNKHFTSTMQAHKTEGLTLTLDCHSNRGKRTKCNITLHHHQKVLQHKLCFTSI